MFSIHGTQIVVIFHVWIYSKILICCAVVINNTFSKMDKRFLAVLLRVFVEFVVFNANVNLFGVSQIVVEFVQTGGGCDLATISSRSCLSNTISTRDLLS